MLHTQTAHVFTRRLEGLQLFHIARIEGRIERTLDIGKTNHVHWIRSE